MPNLPQQFPQPAGVLQNFDWTDLAFETGYVTLYGGTVTSSGAYVLSNQAFWSHRVFTNTTSTANADTTQHDLDFDVTLNGPLDLRGDVLINVPVMIRNRETGSAYDYSAYVVGYVRKWDGSTETDLGSATSETWGGNITAVGTRTFVFTVKVNIGTAVHFKKGETVRITVELHGWGSGGPSTNYCVGHDAQNRSSMLSYIRDTVSSDDLDFVDNITSEASSTIMVVQLPIRVNS